MKYTLLPLFCIPFLSCFAQQQPQFDKIIISYNKGSNSWGQPGIYSRGEELILAPKNSNFYKVVTFLTTEATAGDDGNTFSKDTVSIPISSYKISKNIIDSLFRELSITKDNFTPGFIRPFLQRPSKSEILADARAINEHYKFEDYSHAELSALIGKIRNFDKVDSFLNVVKPNPEQLPAGIVDAWNYSRVRFIKKIDTIGIQLDFVQPLGQPFIVFKNGDFANAKYHVNLLINVLLCRLLPATSVARKELDINALTDIYVRWYIDKIL